MRRDFAHAVDRAGVESIGAMRLGLESDTDVFDGARYDGVGDAGEGAGGVKLEVGKGGVERVGLCIGEFEASTGIVEGAELD